MGLNGHLTTVQQIQIYSILDMKLGTQEIHNFYKTPQNPSLCDEYWISGCLSLEMQIVDIFGY